MLNKTSKVEHIFIIPLAGKGQRFKDAGYTTPKQLLKIDGEYCLYLSLDSLDIPDNSKFVFVLNKENEKALTAIIERYWAWSERKNISFEIIVEPDQIGPVASTMWGGYKLTQEEMFQPTCTIFTMDVAFYPRFDPSKVDEKADGLLLTFKANNPDYSYSVVENGRVIEVKEKEVISPYANVGIFFFKSFYNFLETISSSKTGESIAELFNASAAQGKHVITQETDNVCLFGTPIEYEYWIHKATKKSIEPRVGLCSDHSGFFLKEKVLKNLGGDNIGTFNEADCDFNSFVEKTCFLINQGILNFGVGFCRSGQGINICANKHPNIRSVLIYDYETFVTAIEHNDANFFVFPSRIWEDRESEIVDMILFHPAFRFKAGRFQNRLMRLP